MKKLFVLLFMVLTVGIGLGCSDNSDSSRRGAKPSSSQDVALVPASQYSADDDNEEKAVTVYVTRTGKKYHRGTCSYLRQSKIPMSLKDAKASGYTPCSRCNPPE